MGQDELEAADREVDARGIFRWFDQVNRGIEFADIPRVDATFVFAGVGETDEQGTPTVGIITTAATPSIAMIHDRMPVVLLG